MTFPGADTMKGGIIGEDCLRCIAGFVGDVMVLGTWGSNVAGIESMGDCSGRWVACMGVRFIVAVAARQQPTRARRIPTRRTMTTD